ncbi:MULTISPECIES: hypothetical protein [Alicyclobacillus]|uniref:hypothetical protein n=1 Tax=Alicyclobacillus TaxID=29330 RepID=UPI001F24E4C5|nr:hypothetical protein [Alicyclobacillus fructus]
MLCSSARKPRWPMAFTACAALCVVTACSTPPRPANAVIIPGPASADERVIEDPVGQRFVLYDTVKKIAVSWTNVSNEFVYNFTTPSDLYTMGNSLTNHFSIVQLQNGRAVTVYTLPDAAHDAIFPLAADGQNAFFLLVHYRDDGSEEWRHIVRWDPTTRTLHPFVHVEGAIEQGALAGPTLYFTVLRPDRAVWLYRLPAANLNAEPQLVSTHWTDDPLLAYEGRLVKVADHQFVFDSIHLPVRAVNVLTPQGVLVQFDDDPKSLTTRADVFQLSDGRHLGSATSVEGVEWMPNGVQLDCDGRVEIVSWSYAGGEEENPS